jgi:hypothetical protein
VDDKVAFALITLIQILFWVDFENIVTHLEAYWLNFLGDFLTWLLDVAEGLVGFAVELWKSGCPLSSDLLKYIRWNTKL